MAPNDLNIFYVGEAGLFSRNNLMRRGRADVYDL